MLPCQRWPQFAYDKIHGGSWPISSEVEVKDKPKILQIKVLVMKRNIISCIF